MCRVKQTQSNQPAHHALHEFDQTIRDPNPWNGRGGMTRTPTPAIGLKVEAAMTSADINAELICPLGTPSFPPGPHDYDPKRHDLIEGVSKFMISIQEAQAKFNEYRESQGSHDEVYTDGSKMDERVGAAVVINRHFQNGETTCRQLSKRLPDNSTIFAAEATAITLALNYYQHMGPVHQNIVVYSDSMSCLQAIEHEDIENPFICHIMNLLWSLSDKGTCVRFCWIPSHWRGFNHPTSSWPYQDHQVPYLVPKTAKCLPPLWSNTDHWPCASGVCSATGMSWQILHSWLIDYSLRDNSRDWHSVIPTRSGILLSHMNGQTFYTVAHLNHPDDLMQ